MSAGVADDVDDDDEEEVDKRETEDDDTNDLSWSAVVDYVLQLFAKF